MRRVNLQFLLTFFVCVLVIAGVVHAVHRMQYSKHARSWKRLADDAEQDGKDRLQIDYLRRYTALERSDAAAFEQLGDLLIESNRPREAQLPLTTALNLYEDRPGDAGDIQRVRRQLVVAALRTGRWSDAEMQLTQLIDPDLEAAIAPEQAEYHEQLAICRLALAQWDDAAKELNLAIQNDGSRCASYAMLADLQINRLNNPLDAVRRLQEMVDRNPDLAEALRIRAAFRLQYLNNEGMRRAEATMAAEASADGKSEPDFVATGDSADLPLMSPGDLLALAADDAHQALQRAPKDVEALLVAMHCSHQLSENAAPQQAAAYRAEARSHAAAVIAECQAEADRRIEEFRAELAEDFGNEAENAKPQSQAENEQQVLNKGIRRITREVNLKAVPAYNVLASLDMRDGNMAGAISTLADGLEKTNSDANLLLNLASLKISQSQQQAGEEDEIKSLLGTLNEQPNAQPLVGYLRARQLMVRGEWRMAADALTEAKPRLTRWPAALVEADLAIAACQMQLGRPQVAEAIYRRLLEEDPQSMTAHWGLALSLDAQRRGSEAYPHYRQIVESRGALPANGMYSDLPLRIVRAMIERNSGLAPDAQAWQPVVQFIADTRSAVADAGNDAAQLETIDLLEAELCAARKDLASADRILNSALERNPQSVMCWMALVSVHNLQQEWELSKQTLQRAEAAVGPDDEASAIQLKLTAAMHHLRQSAAAALKAENDDETEAITDQTREIVLQIREIVLQIIGTIPKLKSKDPDERSRYLGAKSGLAQISASLGDTETAVRLYREIAKADVNQLQSRFALLELAIRGGRLDDVQPILDEIEEIDSVQGPLWNFGEATRLAMSTATDEELRRDLRNAEARLKVADRAWPGSVRVRLLQSYIRRREGRTADAVDIDLKLFRDGYATPTFIIQLVGNLYDLQKFEDAAGILGMVKTDAPLSLAPLAPTAMAVSGVVQDEQLSQHLRSLAVSLARTAAVEAVEAKDYRVKLAYAMMLAQNNDHAAAREELEEARDLAPDASEPWLLLIDLDVRSGDLERARQTLEQAALSIRESDRDMALARGYQLLNDLELSRHHLELALAAVPQDLAIATPGQIETLRGAADAYLLRAQLEVSEANKISEDSPDVAAQRLQAAVEFDKTGIKLLDRLVADGSRALAALEAATDKSDDRTATQQGLRNILPPARRRLALTLFAKGGIANRDRARRLVEDNRTLEGFKDDDSRLYAIILSQSPARSDKVKSLTEIENLIQRSVVPQDADRLLAATLHLSEFRHFKRLSKLQQNFNKQVAASQDATSQQHLAAARELMNAIVVAAGMKLAPTGETGQSAASGSYVQALSGLIEILLTNDEPGEAAFYVRQLVAAAPGSQVAINAAANVHFANGEHASAIDVIQRFAAEPPREDAETPPEQVVARILTAMQLLEGFGSRAKEDRDAKAYFDAAERQLAALPPPDIRRQLQLAGYRARRGQAREAIDMLESLADTATDTELTSACVHAMRAAGQDIALQQRLIDILQPALAAYPDSIPIRLMLADLHCWLGQVEPAERLYREVIATNPKNVAALNNLAYLLASQRRELDHALTLIDGAIAQQGPMPELLDTRAFVLLQRGDAQGAITELAKILADVPQPSYLFHMARAKLIAGQRSEAVVDWQMATRGGLSEETIHPAERDDFIQFQSQMPANQ